MKGTELIAELLMSINNGGPINKKTALDRAIGNDSVNGNTLGKLSRECVRTVNVVKRIFPDLHQTRFHNSVEFYSLFLLVWEMDRDNYILTDRRRNRVARALLRKLSNGVDELRDQLRRAKPARPSQRLYSDYVLTVQGDTDSSANRERRRELLRGLLSSLYERKDEKRLFSSEQRRLIWNSDEKRVCRRCKRAMTWEDFTVDHIIAYAKGGKTNLKNAQPLCRRCNSRKGAG
jgi:5-methylcytosine-specific restriction endonuclease McrA